MADRGVVPVLVVAAGARWEAAALEALQGAPGVVLLRRCMDVTDLLAHAAAEDARVAVVAAEAPGLDAEAVQHLTRHGVQPLVVVPEGFDGAVEKVRRLGVRTTIADRRLEDLGATIRGLAAQQPAADPAPVDGARGRVVTVWGPAGAPGRTTVALGIAGELAARGRDPLLVDADPWGGTLAQRLGVLDEVSGLLAAARLVHGDDFAERLVGLQRAVAGFRLLSGLPRADRWVEVRAEVLDAVIASAHGAVVLDTGFSLEEDPALDFGSRPARNGLTLAAIGQADDVVVVGTADPVGLSRLARALTELNEVTGGRPVQVVLNRWRPRLGISVDEAGRLLRGFGDLAAVHTVPEDGPAADRALVTGRTFTEDGASTLTRAFGPVVDALFPDSAVAAEPGRGLRARTAARVLRR